MNHELSSPTAAFDVFDASQVPLSPSTPAASPLRLPAALTVGGLAAQGVLGLGVLAGLVLPVSVTADLVLVFATLGKLSAYLFTVFAFLTWFGRCYDATIQRSGPLSLSKNLAVGGFFIPVYSMVGPYLAARDMWQRAEGSLTSRALPVMIWWGLWVARVFSPMAGDVGAAILELAAIVAAIVFVRGLTRMLQGETPRAF